ncbi:MAG TPA: Sir2 family NAD-dependent protein deacetylase, partial [Reyranella sp.]|nr:Sir2 family NAD-dependent protein deacetylase [Reyranella sp.]
MLPGARLSRAAHGMRQQEERLWRAALPPVQTKDRRIWMRDSSGARVPPMHQDFFPPGIVVLTGAGISKESGIDTFRDEGGLWTRFDIEEVATIEAWHRDRKK